MTLFRHEYAFDPNYGYSLDDLLSITPPKAPDDFIDFWYAKYQKALRLNPTVELNHTGYKAGFKIYDINYLSSDGFLIGGWLLEPDQQAVRQCIVVGHGYGGRDQPDYHFDIPNTAYLFPCFRGLSRSRCVTVSDQPQYHVIHNLDNPNTYILGGCVEDLWLAVSLLLKRYPATTGRIGYMGISFGAGIGALAMACDTRIQRGHLNVPTFGHQPLRLQLPSIGSAEAVQAYIGEHEQARATLAYYDAATAASYVQQAGFIAAALFDPLVAPPGQFAIYNSWAGPKQLFVLQAGHFDYPEQVAQNQQLLIEIQDFFGEMQH